MDPESNPPWKSGGEMNQRFQILRHTFRRLRGRPLYTAVIILCLALGIGANSAIFSVVNTLLLHPLLVNDIDRLVFTLDMRTADDPFEASGVDYIAFKKQASAFTSVGVGRRDTFRLLGTDRPEQLEGAAVADDYFSTLGVNALRGRIFTPEDNKPGAGSVAIISYEFWQNHFGGDASAVGRTFRLNDRIYELIGVMPRGFDLPLSTSVWVPLAANIETLPVQENTRHNMFLIGRLKPGVSVEQANAEVRSIASNLEKDFPAQRRGWGLKLIPLRQQILGDITGHLRPAIYLLVFVVGFLLLITCANVANLLLVRSLERSHEVAVQIALGASKKRLVTQLLTESVILSLAGGIVGLLLARFGASLFAVFKPISTFSFKSVLEHIEVDSKVVLFTFVVALATGILFGLAPVFQASLPGSLIQHLREGGQRGSSGISGRRLLKVLMIGEIVMAVVLLIGAGLMVKNLQQLQNTKLGFRTDHLLAMQMHLSSQDYPGYTERADFVKRLVERARAVPGVTAAGITTNIPLSLSSFDASYTVEGKPLVNMSEVPITADRVVTPGYLEMMGVPLLRGRFLTDQDRLDTLPVIVVTKNFAQRAWPGEDPIGKRVKRGYPPREDSPWYTVVGLADDVKEDRFNYRVDRPVWYMAYAQRDLFGPIQLVVRTDGNPSTLTSALRNAVYSLNKNQPIAGIVTLDEHIADFFGPQRFSALAGTIFAFIGLVLAVVGIYSVTAYSVTQRAREFGVRLALGAGWRDLTRLVLVDGLRLVGIGLVIGSLGGLVLGKIISGVLYEVSPAAPGTFIGTALLLILVTLLAMYVPTRRVVRIDPSKTLRYE